ncbi:MAG: hypothetical protein V1754_12160 [Pseudomonadota bacterium]
MDDSGCLTPEAICFADELQENHLAVVRRHIKTCYVCAQQKADITKTAQQIRSAKPLTTKSHDALKTTRQAALREVVVRRMKLPDQPDLANPHIPWSRSKNFWLSALICFATAILAIGITILFQFVTCKRTPHAPPFVVRFSKAQLHTNFGASIVAVGQSANGVIAVGTTSGDILLLQKPGPHFYLLFDHNSTDHKTQPEAGTEKVMPPNHDGQITSLSFSDNGRYLLSTGGHSAIFWDTESRKMVRQVKGSDLITAGVLDAAGQTAFFGTSLGYLLRWPLDRPDAQGIKRFHCHRWSVYSARRRLPETQRCPFGTYVEMDNGQSTCAYPVTHLVRQNSLLVRACRDGVVSFMDLSKQRYRGYSSGALNTLTFVGPNHLLLGMTKGELQILRILDRKDPPHGEIEKTLAQKFFPTAASSVGDLIAVAKEKRIHFWKDKMPAGALDVPNKVVWLGLKTKPLGILILLEDGRLEWRLISF